MKVSPTRLSPLASFRGAKSDIRRKSPGSLRFPVFVMLPHVSVGTHWLLHSRIRRNRFTCRLRTKNKMKNRHPPVASGIVEGSDEQYPTGVFGVSPRRHHTRLGVAHIAFFARSRSTKRPPIVAQRLRRAFAPELL